MNLTTIVSYAKNSRFLPLLRESTCSREAVGSAAWLDCRKLAFSAKTKSVNSYALFTVKYVCQWHVLFHNKMNVNV